MRSVRSMYQRPGSRSRSIVFNARAIRFAVLSRTSLLPLHGWNVGLRNICGVGQVALCHASLLSGRTNAATKEDRHLIVATLLAPDRPLRRCRSSHAHRAPYQDSRLTANSVVEAVQAVPHSEGPPSLGGNCEEPTEPRTLKCQDPPLGAGHEHPAETGRSSEN